jgi:gliding motility-associated-like protein
MRKLLSLALSILCFQQAFAGEGNLQFVENRNQWVPQVKYRADLSGGAIFLTKEGFTYSYFKTSDLETIHEMRHKNADIYKIPVHFHAYKVLFAGSNPNVTVSSREKKEAYYNYFLGNDPSKWAEKAGSYGQVNYSQLYPGVDLNVYSKGTSLKYDFIVAPGADASVIAMNFDGVKPSLTKDGDLKIMTSVNTVLEKAPYVYQLIDGQQKQVPCKYTVSPNGQVAFAFPQGYDQSKELVIDPVLVFATYSGSTGNTYGFSATYDLAGSLYAGGEVFTVGWPSSTGAFQLAFAGGVDAGLNKYSPNGSSLLYSTYYGGNGGDVPNNMIVNAANELIICGSTSSGNLPVTAGCYDNSFNGAQDLYVAKFNATGTALLAATYVGGTSTDGSNSFSLSPNYGDQNRGEVYVDAQDNVLVAGSTQSSDFPTTSGAYQTTFAGMQDGCIFKLNPSFSTLLFSTFLGGADEDACFSIAKNSAGDIVVVGGTKSNDFPTTSGSYQSAFQGATDGFATILSGSGATLLKSTYMGTTAYDHGFKVQVDPTDDVWVCGQTQGNYPVTAGVYSNANGGIFLHKLSADLSTSLVSTTIGEDPNTTFSNLIPTAFLYDNCGNVYFCGFGAGSNLPLTPNAFQTSQGGFWLCVLNPGMTALNFATYMGGPGDHVDGGTSRFDPQGIVYHSVCTSGAFPASAGSYCTSNQTSAWDVASFKFNFEAMGVVASVGFVAKDSICLPNAVQFINTSTSALNYEWDFGDNSPISTAVSPTHTYPAAGTYTIMLHANNPTLCITDDTAYLTVKVFELQPVQLSVKDTIVCVPGPITVTANVANVNPNMAFHWEPASAILGNPNQQTVQVDGTVGNVFTVTVTDSIGTICKETAIGIIHINQFDVTSYTAIGDTTICPGDTTTLRAIGGNFYTWTPFDRMTSGTDPVVNVWPKMTTTYKVLISDVNGCQVEKPVTVSVYPKVTADAGEDDDIKYGDGIYLHATGGVQYQWTPNIALTPDNSSTPRVNPLATTTYHVEVTSLEGCKAIDEVTIHVMNAIIPSAFTPNGDGRNDEFRLVPNNPAIKLLVLNVYDRWGTKVFSTDNINVGWDGKTGGVPSEIGTYFYTFTYVIGHKQFVEKGDVTLIR